MSDPGSSPEAPIDEPTVRPKPRRWPLGALTLIAVIVVGVGILVFGGDDDASTATSIPTLGTIGVPTGDEAPDFAIDLIGGGRFVMADELAAGRPVVLNLWASWCLPCREEMPAFDAVAAAHPEVSFIGVAVEDDPIAAEEFAAEIGVSYPLAIDESDAVSNQYPSPGLPTTFFISTDGRIIYTVYGGVTEAEIVDVITKVFGS